MYTVMNTWGLIEKLESQHKIACVVISTGQPLQGSEVRITAESMPGYLTVRDGAEGWAPLSFLSDGGLSVRAVDWPGGAWEVLTWGPGLSDTDLTTRIHRAIKEWIGSIDSGK